MNLKVALECMFVCLCICVRLCVLVCVCAYMCVAYMTMVTKMYCCFKIKNHSSHMDITSYTPHTPHVHLHDPSI